MASTTSTSTDRIEKLSIGTKEVNGGTTANGRLAATEVNEMVSATNQLLADVGTIEYAENLSSAVVGTIIGTYEGEKSIGETIGAYEKADASIASRLSLLTEGSQDCEADAYMTFTSSSSVVTNGKQTEITLTATSLHGRATILIYDDTNQEEITSATNAESTSAKITRTLTADTTYTASVTYFDDEKIIATYEKSITVKVMYPMYCGFGTSAEDVMTSSNQLSAQKTLLGEYSKTSSSDGVNWFLMGCFLDVETYPEHFKVNGVEMQIEDTIEVINDKPHLIYQSKATYNSGTTLNVVVS